MTDVVLVALVVVGFTIGYFRGAVRQLIAVGAWAVSFLLGAHARPIVGDLLGDQWTQYSQSYAEMLAFGLVFGVLFTVGLLLAEIPGSRITLTQHEWLDDITGGLVGALLALVVSASVKVILATAYAQGLPPVGDHVLSLRDLHTALLDASFMRTAMDSLISGLGLILGPVLPVDVRLTMGAAG